MPNSLFPGASHTFVVLRKSNVMVGFNTVLGTAVGVASGVPVTLREDTLSLIATDNGVTYTGLYRGMTSNKYDIRIKDILSDQTENDSEGNPIQYEVQGSTRNFAVHKLRLRRTAFST